MARFNSFKFHNSQIRKKYLAINFVNTYLDNSFPINTNYTKETTVNFYQLNRTFDKYQIKHKLK